MNDTIRYKKNMDVIHNVHLFKKYFTNIGELAFSSNVRIYEREIDSNSLTF